MCCSLVEGRHHVMFCFFFFFYVTISVWIVEVDSADIDYIACDRYRYLVFRFARFMVVSHYAKTDRTYEVCVCVCCYFIGRENTRNARVIVI